MTTLCAHHRLTAWLAVLAVLWGCLLPVVSHAVAAHHVGDKGWVEVCTATGMAWVNSADASVTADTDYPRGGTGVVMTGCDWCATHNPLTGLPTLAQPMVAPLSYGADAPAAFFHAPRPLFVWAAAQSRAPPAFA